MVCVIGVIGGSGFYTFFGDDARSVSVETPYGEPSAPITVGRVGTHQVAFLPRHGRGHEFSPHTVPYLANMWALRALGVRRVFGPCAVGSLTAELGPGAVVVPDQLVDRTRHNHGLHQARYRDDAGFPAIAWGQFTVEHDDGGEAA